MEQIVTIEEEYTLPSKGLMYAKPFDPTVKLRSMTVADEMRRLSQTKTPFKQMADLIESCLLTKLPIPVYDLNMCDYTFLLHKLRITTYGSNYTLRAYCPHCDSVVSSENNLAELRANRNTAVKRRIRLETELHEKEIQYSDVSNVLAVYIKEDNKNTVFCINPD